MLHNPEQLMATIININWLLNATSFASRGMPKQSQNEINKYCSCYSEYIYKCQDFCDGSGNELWPLPQSVPYNLKYLPI